MPNLNGVGDKFDLNVLIEAQNTTKEIVKRIASNVFIGMSEKEGIELIESEFKKWGEFKFWHPHKFRIGSNTCKSFREESDGAIRLKVDDLFFIDIGPIINNHEGDYGETFVMGDNPHYLFLKKTVEELFYLAQNEFINQGLNGKGLYQFLEKKASEKHVQLNLRTLGHRVGDFPHHLFFRGKLQEVEESIIPHLWVLEVQVSDLKGQFGAFYEDILCFNTL